MIPANVFGVILQAVSDGVGAVHFLALIPLAWCFLSWLLSRLSGWSLLAQHFKDSGAEPDGEDVEAARFRTGRLGAVTYHSCLHFRVGSDGLWISVALPLRLGHPPLFIPWDQVHHISKDKVRYSRRIRASIGTPTLVRATLPGWVRYRLPECLRLPQA